MLNKILDLSGLNNNLTENPIIQKENKEHHLINCINISISEFSFDKKFSILIIVILIIITFKF